MQEMVFDGDKFRPGWEKFGIETTSRSAFGTYTNGEFIVQERSAVLYNTFLNQNGFLKANPSKYTATIADSIELSDDRKTFWTLSKRIDTPESPAHLDFYGVENEKVWELFDTSYRDILETIVFLNTREPDENVLRLYDSFLSPMKLANPAYLNVLLKTAGIDIVPPRLPKTDFVISHGDPLIKNTIQVIEGGQKEYRLIDWEFLGITMRYSDPAHMLSWILKYTEGKLWDHYINKYIEPLSEVMSLNQNDALKVIVWSILRDFVLWNKPEKFEMIKPFILNQMS